MSDQPKPTTGEFRVDRYAVICPSGQMLHRYRTLDLRKRVRMIRNNLLAMRPMKDEV